MARLRDIREAAELALRHLVGKEREALDAEPLLAAGIIRWILVIGEAARTLSDDMRGRAPSIPWTQIVGARHVMTHEYWRVDLDAVWVIATSGLKPLHTAVSAILDEIDGTDHPDRPAASGEDSRT